MIDWAVVISTAVGFMAAFVTKVGEGYAIKVGEELFTITKKKFKADKEGRAILTNFQKKPTRYKSALIDILNEKVEADETFGNNIRNIVERESKDTDKITQVASGIGNAQATGNKAKATTNVKIKN